ncbi:UNVERIFIED_CONTAM: 7-deoxyloganetic acid glucosyl transferase [Sesamum calycinum]|uniref:7-deoxyloganetic acid glucosyl transferase n=1 Tax=Sesamum calycinum TaxID=2727403 RepID=A0AAW2LRX2_9LAMI
MGTDTELPPHVLIFPLPMQGHINSMLKLAELFCLANLHVTMLLSEYTHGRLRRHANIESRFSRYPGFRVATIPDGLPEDHPRVGERTMEIVMSLLKVGGAEFRKLMETTDALSDGGGKDEGKYDYWKKEELDLMVTSVCGNGGLSPATRSSSVCRVNDVNDPGFQTIIRETRRTALSSGLILNSFEDLEGPILDQIRKPIPNLYSIGPLHTHLKARLESQKSEESSLPSSSFYEEDRSSMSWLDSQPAKSVLYVSFGSVTLLTRNELLEFWYGLVNSGHKFLWVMRPDSIVGDNKDNPNSAELEEGTKERGYLVGWVPQNEVLAHPSVGAFFTHSGWNSTLEGIAAGMPMICWPYFADQTINSRFVSDVWKVGLDMKDSCDRVIVERMVRT